MSATGVLAGRRVVVTGAGVGLGRAYALAAAAEGASVVVNDVDATNADETVDAIRATGATAEAFVGDVADWDTARALVEFCVGQCGGIDGLVNNAGVLGKVGSVLEDDPDSIARVMRVNVLGAIYPSIHAARAMTEAGVPGAIVNVSSGNQCGHPMLATYGASRGATSTLTYAWAEALAGYGIRVNAISPNAMTPMVTNALREFGGPNVEGERPLPSPEENAAVVTYLLSDRSAALTGQVVRVDSGQLSVTSHPVVVQPQVPIEFSLDTVTEAFEGPLRNTLQPGGISLATVEHIGPVY